MEIEVLEGRSPWSLFQDGEWYRCHICGWWGYFGENVPDKYKLYRYELEEVSEDSYNIILYYETEQLGARAAFNSRSDYLMPGGGSFRGAERRGDDRTQLDLAFRYAVNDNMNLSLEIFNLTDEILYEYEADRNRPRNYFSYGRTISFGLRYEM